MSSINIRRDVQDSFYRYKMPKIQSKIEGKGNGIKTVVPNMTDVARALARSPIYITKFFGFELGALTKVDGDRYIINGAHDANKLQDQLDGFIKKFVLCASCKNPETALVLKDGNILRDCKACGERTTVLGKDRLIGYITKDLEANAKAGKKGKKGKKDANDGMHAKAPTSPGNDEDDDSADDALTHKIQTEAAGLKDKKSARGGADDDDWAVDTSEDAVKARIKNLEGSMKSSLVIGEDDEEEEEEGESPYQLFGEWIEQNKDTVSDVDIYKKAEELHVLGKSRTVQVLVSTLFDKDILSQVESKAPLFAKMINGEKHERSLLGGTEKFLGVKHTELIPQTSNILMLYYQNSLLSEAVALKWGQKSSSKRFCDRAQSKKIREAAKPFLKWLEEADSDEESEEEEEEE